MFRRIMRVVDPLAATWQLLTETQPGRLIFILLVASFFWAVKRYALPKRVVLVTLRDDLVRVRDVASGREFADAPLLATVPDGRITAVGAEAERAARHPAAGLTLRRVLDARGPRYPEARSADGAGDELHPDRHTPE